MKNPISLFKEFVDDSKIMESLENCLNNIKLCEWENKKITDKFWVEVHSYRNSSNDNTFIELSSFALSILTFPYSNAEVERSFSLMNVIVCFI